jgi:hypothetical protein
LFIGTLVPWLIEILLRNSAVTDFITGSVLALAAAFPLGGAAH